MGCSGILTSHGTTCRSSGGGAQVGTPVDWALEGGMHGAVIGVDRSLEEDRMILRAAESLDAKTRRRVRRSVRRGVSVIDEATKPLAAIYWELYDRALTENARPLRGLRWFSLVAGVLWLGLGVLNLATGRGCPWVADVPMGITWLVLFTIQPNIETRKRSRLEAGRSTIFKSLTQGEAGWFSMTPRPVRELFATEMTAARIEAMRRRRRDGP